MYKIVILVVFSLVKFPFSDSFRILCVFPLPFANQQVVFRSLTDELLQRGHELIVVTTDPGHPKNETPANLKEIDVHEVAYSIWNAEMADTTKAIIENPDESNLPQVFEIVHLLFINIFKNEEFQNVIKEGKFDLLLLDANAHSSLILSHLIKVPVILISSPGSISNYNPFGGLSQEFLYPSVLRRRIFEASVWEQICDVFKVKRIENHLNKFEDVQYQSFREVIGDDVPTIKELNDNVDLLLLNQFPVWEGIRPVSKNVVYLGGLNTKSAGELPQDLLDFFNTSVNGVIYVSLGSTVDHLIPIQRLQVLVNVLSQTPYDVLWRWEKDELPGKGQKIRIAKSLPQGDLLRQPKVKLFITNGDLQSTEEAIAGGVPVIGIPFMDDQFFNCENYLRHKIGLKLDITTLTELELKGAISRVVTDKGYRDNVVNLRVQMHDQQQSSIVRAVSWIDHILAHGAGHLRPPAANMPWYQYLELELIATALGLYAVIVVLSIVLCYCLIRGVWRCYKRYNHRRMMDCFPR